MRKRLRINLFTLIKRRELALGRQITNKEIAETIGVSQASIGRWKRGEVSQLNARVVEGLCEFCDCNISDLLYLESTEE